MSKPKTDAKRKGSKRQKPDVAAKPERCKWDPAFCEKVEALGAEGKSAPEIRKALGISPSAWRNWTKAHPDFAESVELAADLAEAWWIDVGRKGMMLGTNFSAQTFIYLTKNIFPARFRDKQDHTISGPNDGPIVQELRVPNLAEATDAQAAFKEFEASRASLARAPVTNGHGPH